MSDMESSAALPKQSTDDFTNRHEHLTALEAGCERPGSGFCEDPFLPQRPFCTEFIGQGERDRDTETEKSGLPWSSFHPRDLTQLPHDDPLFRYNQAGSWSFDT
jgi:hypothetical protein